MAETINLTPQSANYNVYFDEPSNNLTPNTPFEESAMYLVTGYMDRINIGISHQGTPGVNGVFKNPPLVPYVKLNDVSLVDADNAVLGHIDNGIICTPNGKMFFKPTFLAVLMKAIADNQLDVSDVAAVKIDFEAKPVYENPSGTTPEFAIKQFIIMLTLGQVPIDALPPLDNADSYPWLSYDRFTRETSASIG